MLHLKEVVRGPLNVFAYLMTVRRTVEKRSKNKHVQCALENARSLFCPFFDRRHATLDRRDGRLSTTEPSRTESQDGPVDDFRPMRVSNLESARSSVFWMDRRQTGDYDSGNCSLREPSFNLRSLQAQRSDPRFDRFQPVHLFVATRDDPVDAIRPY
jgi:hypothetical protein